MKKRYLTLLFFLLCDFILTIFSLGLSLVLTGETIFNTEISVFYLYAYLAGPAIMILISYILKIYNILWVYSSVAEMLRIVVASIFTVSALFITQRAVFGVSFNIKTYVIMLFLLAFFVAVQRMSFKHIAINVHNSTKFAEEIGDTKPIRFENIMLIGAGSAGEIIINEMSRRSEYHGQKIRCVIDDDPYKIGQYISGIKIVGDRNSIIESSKKYNISVIIFAIPNCPKSVKAEILEICQGTGCRLKIVPSVAKMYNASEIPSTIREVEIEDLLGRDPIDITNPSAMHYVADKVVLVTGGGGTIGSELCRQIAHNNPKQLIIFDIYENSAYEIQNEILHKYPDLELITLIGSVRDSKRLEWLFATYKPNIVYHAAAHKHVPLMEESPNETIKNNVFGTLKTANCADKYGAEKFVLISTDKAVNPTNIMGASKRICEMIIQSCNAHSKTDFVAVRFGNVLGSNGSVIPLFKKQISHGGPVTVTDPNIIRYFMTIPEAVSLVLQAGANANGGEIFVLDMGEPVKILTLAENLIKLSGFTPYKDIPIVFTGLRPGEKLYEELLMSEEGLTATANKLIHIGKPIEFDEKVFFDTLEKMKAIMYDETIDIKGLVRTIVPTYKPENITNTK